MNLERLARTMVRRRRWVVAAWALILVAAATCAAAVGANHRVDYSIPGSGSARAQQLLRERFPELSGDTVQLVVATDEGANLDTPALADRLDVLQAAARTVDHVSAVRVDAMSADHTVALVSVQLDATTEKVPVESIKHLMDIARTSTDRAAGFTVEAGGGAVQTAESGESGSEAIGLGAALIILLIVFGSVLAAGLPILVAVFGLGVALSMSTVLTHLFVVPDWAPNLVTMIGLGVGIDYALFIVTRYRTALANGQEPEDAIVAAITTAGRAVVFAGGTVVISLTGLAAMRLEYLYGTAAVTVTGVLIVLVASMTLLPAILGFAGHNIDRLRVPFVRGDRGERGLWAKWSHVVQRKPVVTGTIALVVLVGLAAPAVNLRFGYPDAGTGPTSLTSRRAYDLVDHAFGKGANGPLVVAVELEGDQGAAERVQAALAADPGIASALPARINAAGDTAVIIAYPVTGPQDEKTVDLIHHLRDDVLPPTLTGGAARVHVGGAVAASVDESELLSGRLPIFISAVIALSFFLLLVVFRSLLVALKAALMNVLAIGAAYGVMSLALSGGWFGRLFGITESTPVPAWLPMMMFAMLFGLSMDYEVFLLSRIREEYDRTRDNARAVAHGIASTGRVITAAAAIMISVFGAFILSDQVLTKVIGLGLAVAVLLDATVVRMVLVPSTMEVLGDRNWWVPKWLDRILPHVDIEGESATTTQDLDLELEVLLDQSAETDLESSATR